MTTHFELHKGQHPGWLSDEDRPAWLDRVEPIVFFDGQHWYGEAIRWRAYELEGDDVNASVLRLPLDYWAIPALKAGYRPWAGGDEAPKDWNKGEVLRDNGEINSAPHYSVQWSRGWGGDRFKTIIGYMPATPKPDTGKTYPPEWVEQVVDHLREEVRGVLSQSEYRERAIALLSEIDPPQADPLVEALEVAIPDRTISVDIALDLRAELAKHGLQITEIAA